jgi:F0F1-type ATP synthase alpha subunit
MVRHLEELFSRSQGKLVERCAKVSKQERFSELTALPITIFQWLHNQNQTIY